jgi:hypothetical protein
MPQLPNFPTTGARGGSVHNVHPGWLMRVSQAAKYAISGVTPTNWFGPFQPLQPVVQDPMAEGTQGRRMDYQTGRNLNYYPRGELGVSFGDMRALAKNCEVLRGVIEARKDQIAAIDWAIRPRSAWTDGTDDDTDSGVVTQGQMGLADPATQMGGKMAKRAPRNGVPPPVGSSKTPRIGGNRPDPVTGNRPVAIKKTDVNTIQLPLDVRKRIQDVTDFFQYPDKEHTWDQWCRALNEDMFVIDAATLYKRRTNGGSLYALEYIDGATIFPLIDAFGRRPQGPTDPSYQQILHGVAACDYKAEELMYMPRNVSTHRYYGYSPVEQVVWTTNTAIRRAAFQLEYYVSGSTPDAFVGLPEGWNLQNVKDFQLWFDSLMSGDLANRRKVRFMPGQFKYVETKEPPLKDSYDEWLARIICFIFSISPEPFIEHLNRATAGTARSRALEEGLLPLQRWWKNLMDAIIRYDLGQPDLEFVFLDDREQDPKVQMEVDTGYVKAGIRAIDEVREARGWNPYGGPAENPMALTTAGYVPLGALTGPGAVAAMATGGAPAANAVHGTATGDNGGVGNASP